MPNKERKTAQQRNLQVDQLLKLALGKGDAQGKSSSFGGLIYILSLSTENLPSGFL